MMARHSSTPWRCSTNGERIYSELLEYSKEGSVAFICAHEDPAIADANAALIEAAPDLLAACEWAARSNHHPKCPVALAKSNHCECHVGAACAAIAKATQEVMHK